jgi:hypothetical protein
MGLWHGERFEHDILIFCYIFTPFVGDPPIRGNMFGRGNAWFKPRKALPPTKRKAFTGGIFKRYRVSFDFK